MCCLAVEPDDYTALFDVLNFPACESRVCRDVMIVADDTAEEVETFNVTLAESGTLDDRITLDPTVAIVEIIDASSKCRTHLCEILSNILT